MLSIKKAIKRLTLFSTREGIPEGLVFSFHEGIPEILSNLTALEYKERDVKRVNLLRQQLNLLYSSAKERMNPDNKPYPYNVDYNALLAMVAHNALVALAEYCPLNKLDKKTQEPLSLITHKKIEKWQRVFIDTGHVFDKTDLIERERTTGTYLPQNMARVFFPIALEIIQEKVGKAMEREFSETSTLMEALETSTLMEALISEVKKISPKEIQTEFNENLPAVLGFFVRLKIPLEDVAKLDKKIRSELFQHDHAVTCVLQEHMCTFEQLTRLPIEKLHILLIDRKSTAAKEILSALEKEFFSPFKQSENLSVGSSRAILLNKPDKSREETSSSSQKVLVKGTLPVIPAKAGIQETRFEP